MNGRRISPHGLALVLAAAAACWHIAWSLLVLFGWAQEFINLVFWLHFITPPHQVGAFVPWRAMALVAVTTVVGYVLGRALGAIWNWVHER